MEKYQEEQLEKLYSNLTEKEINKLNTFLTASEQAYLSSYVDSNIIKESLDKLDKNEIKYFLGESLMQTDDDYLENSLKNLINMRNLKKDYNEYKTEKEVDNAFHM